MAFVGRRKYRWPASFAFGKLQIEFGANLADGGVV
jgi:hypothetical protein